MKLQAQLIVISVLSCLLMSPALAQEESQKQSADDISQAVNPSKAKARFFIRNEFRKREDDTEINVLEPV